MNCVQNDLVQQEGVSTKALYKLVAPADGLMLIIAKLYEPEYLGTVGSRRAVLNLTLYLLLMVDIVG